MARLASMMYLSCGQAVLWPRILARLRYL